MDNPSNDLQIIISKTKNLLINQAIKYIELKQAY